MKKRARRWLGALALSAGALGAGAYLLRKRGAAANERAPARPGPHDRWARPGMSVTFRAEVMPGRERSERTFRVAELLPSGRVTLAGFAGEHAEGEFEPVRFK